MAAYDKLDCTGEKNRNLILKICNGIVYLFDLVVVVAPPTVK